MKPSLRALFSRSSYLSLLSDNDDNDKKPEDADCEAPTADPLENTVKEKKREERERFAVAAMALCIERDPDFKRRFARCILGNEKLADDKNWITEVEPHQCADLVIEVCGEIHIVECKTGAALQTKQTPGPNFFDDGNYGQLIEHHFRGRSVHYLTLGADPWLPEDAPKHKRWRYSPPKSWGDLLNSAPTSPWEIDFFGLLESFKISAARKIMNNNIVQELDALSSGGDLRLALATLQQAAANAELPIEQLEWQAEWESSPDTFWMGLKICGLSDRNTAHQHQARRNLKEHVGSQSGAEIGWFGFAQDTPDGAFDRHVWLYCGSNEARKNCRALIKNAKISALCEIRDVPGHAGFSLMVRRIDPPPKNVLADAMWFAKILRVFSSK